MLVRYKPIGTVHGPFSDIAGMPIQPAAAEGVRGSIEIRPEYAEGLKDLDGFSHVIVIYHFHRAEGKELTVTPFLDDRPRGVFATRAPTRPNPIGLSVLKVLRLEGNLLHVENLDMLDGTPVLDVKPYVPEFDNAKGVRVGWLEKARGSLHTKLSDDRFR